MNPPAVATPDSAPADCTVPPLPFVYRAGKKLRHRVSAMVARSSRVGDQPVYDPALFPWTAEVESRWTEIRGELEALLARREAIPPLASISPDHRRIAPPGKWKSFFLHGYGYRVEENIRRCPKTAEIVARIPGLNSAFFSILDPGAHIPRHRGVTKAILTAHLGLIVPERRESCRMLLHDRMLHWREGRSLVFDDTFQHEVWNDSGALRAVLLIQFRRPVGPARTDRRRPVPVRDPPFALRPGRPRRNGPLGSGDAALRARTRLRNWPEGLSAFAGRTFRAKVLPCLGNPVRGRL